MSSHITLGTAREPERKRVRPTAGSNFITVPSQRQPLFTRGCTAPTTATHLPLQSVQENEDGVRIARLKRKRWHRARYPGGGSDASVVHAIVVDHGTHT